MPFRDDLFGSLKVVTPHADSQVTCLPRMLDCDQCFEKPLNQLN